MKIKITFTILFLSTFFAVAQTKLGTINEEYIIKLMPEAKIVVARSQEYGAKLDSSFTIKIQEFQTKLKDYQDKEKEMSELMKKTVTNELATLEQEIKKYQQNGTTLMQLKQEELMRPLYAKLYKAIEEVAKADGYTQVLTSNGNQFSYIDEKYDITKLVMAKLGVKEPEPKKE